MKLLLLAISFVSLNTYAALCGNWSAPEVLGHLDEKIINEASGLAISSKFEDRLYHINDSGDGPSFYQTAFNGSETKKISIKDFEPKDVEDLAYGNCGESNCLIIADIGDNKEAREKVSFVFIEEKENFPEEVAAKLIVDAKYPDRPHNVEGVAMHPNGDIFIVTKEIDYLNQRAAPAEVFVLRADEWKNYSGEVVTLTHLGTLDFPFHLYDYNLWGRIVTALDISHDGKKLLVLTYKVAIEIDLDINEGVPNLRELKPGENFKVIDLSALKLPQQEAMAYLPGENSFILNTEYHKEVGPAPLLKVSCK